MEYVLIICMSGFFIHAIFLIREEKAEQRARLERERTKMIKHVSKWRKV